MIALGKLLLSDDRLKEITKGALQKRGLTLTGYSVEEMQAMADNLCNSLCKAISDVIPSFNVSAVEVLPPVKDYDDSYTVKIHFPDEILKRKSLWTGGKGRYMGYTGEGVYDLISLYTAGYTAKKRVYGYWVGHSNNSYSASRTYLDANAFISIAINAFMAEHPDVKINYPHEWGG